MLLIVIGIMIISVKVNLMLDNVDDSEMSDTERSIGESVGYFFLYKYFQMISLFYRDIPWIEHVLTESIEKLPMHQGILEIWWQKYLVKI